MRSPPSACSKLAPEPWEGPQARCRYRDLTSNCQEASSPQLLSAHKATPAHSTCHIMQELKVTPACSTCPLMP